MVRCAPRAFPRSPPNQTFNRYPTPGSVTKNRGRAGDGIASLAEWYYQEEMDTLSLKVPREIARWLEEQARTTGRPKSEIVREAIERLRSAGKDESALDLAGDAVGRVASRCRDLGSNKARLRGFGR